MASIKLIDEDEATGKVKQIYNKMSTRNKTHIFLMYHPLKDPEFRSALLYLPSRVYKKHYIKLKLISICFFQASTKLAG